MDAPAQDHGARRGARDRAAAASSTGSTGTGDAAVGATAEEPSRRPRSPRPAPGRTATPGQLRSLLRAAHPRQAVATAGVLGLLVALMGRPGREVALSVVAVLVVQLLLGLLDDVSDAAEDQRTQAPRKPIAAGHLPAGNATFTATVLALLAVPLSLQNGFLAGGLLLATVAVGVLHHRVLRHGWLSWVGLAVSYALLTGFVSYGGWGSETVGSAPVVAFTALAAVLGALVHVALALPDLVTDNRGGVRAMPLRIALRTGAPALFFATYAALAVVVVAMTYVALTQGIAV